MRKLIWAPYICIVSGLFAAEAAFFLDDLSPWRRCAALFWIIGSSVILLSAWATAFAPFLEREFWALPHRAWYLMAFFLPPFLVLLNAGGTYFTHVDGEGLDQLAGGIKLIRYDPSLGIFRLSYFSYPARQFVLNSLPSYFFGPSLWAARLGNSMLYIGSYLFFLSALASYLRSRRTPDPLLFASYCGVMIALAQYTLLNARKFEQTTMPIAVTLFFLGALLLFLVNPGPLRFLWVTWSFGFFPSCYTPALGTWVLALGALVYLIGWKHRRILIATVAYGIACVYVAYRVVKTDDAGSIPYKFQFGLGHGTVGDWTLRYLHSLRAVIGSDFTLIPAPLALALFAALYLAWRYRDYLFAAICAWAVAIVVVSVTTFGSNLNLPYYDVHRTMIILPPLALGAVLLIIRYLTGAGDPSPSAKVLKFMIKLSMVYMVFTGVCTVFLVRSFFGASMTSDYDEIMAQIDRVARSPSFARPARIYLVPPLDVILEPGLRYFAPEAKVLRSSPPTAEKSPGTYVFSYLSANPEDRIDEQRMPSTHMRPFIRMVAE